MNEDDHLKNPNKCKKISIEKKRKNRERLNTLYPLQHVTCFGHCPLRFKIEQIALQAF